MHRKVLLSFLGTSEYKLTRYYINDPEMALPPRKFVQEATFDLICTDFGEEDYILVFTTPKAIVTNWEDSITKEEDRFGLKTLFTAKNLPCQWKNIPIPNGETTEEIWEIFQIIFEQLEENDQLYFDITHGFRSIPMLNMVLINYAKLLKNISVKSITYGAYEAKKTNGTGETCTPLWNLLPFTELQDWSIAAGFFMDSGNTSGIVNLINERVNPILSSTKGQDPTARTMDKLSKNLNSLDRVFTTNRGREIIKGKIFQQIDANLKELQNNPVMIRPLVPVLEKLRSKLAGFEEDNPINWIMGVHWCLRHNLIQQAITQLQEGMITQAVLETLSDPPLDFLDKTNRNLAAQAYNIVSGNITFENWLLPSSDYPDLSLEIQNTPIVKTLNKVYQGLTGIRNDINHSGYTKPMEAKRFMPQIWNYYKEVESYMI